MIELRTLSGEEIELKSNEITIELNNSLFNDGSQLKGSFSYPISLALSPNNIRLFGFANQLEVSPKVINIPILLKAGTQSFKNGILNISVTENAFEGTVKIGIGSISEKSKTVKLTEIPFKKWVLGSNNEIVKRVMMDAARNTDWRVIPYSFIPTRNANFYGTFKPKDRNVGSPEIKLPGLVNEVIFTNNVGTFSIITNVSQIVPYFYLSYVLNEIASFFGFTLTGDFVSHPDVKKVLIYDVNGTTFFRAPDYMVNIAAHNHLPAITVAEFFKSLSSFFCCRIKVDDKKHELDISWKKLVFQNRTYQNWTDKLVAVTNQKFVLSEGYTISAQLNNTEKKDEVVVLAGGEKVEAKAGTIQFIKEQLASSSNVWRIPQNDLAGNLIDDAFKDFENYRMAGAKLNDFPLRFLYTNGIVTENGVTYPKGTNEGIDFNLQICGKKGLFNYAHKPWLERTYAGKVIKAKFLLSENDINQLDDEHIIQVNSANGVTVECLIKKLTFTSSMNRDFLIAEAEMVVLGFFEMSVTGAVEEVIVGTIEVFVRLRITNYTNELVSGGSTDTYADIIIELFEDKKCTVPHIGNGFKVDYTCTRKHEEHSFAPNHPPNISSFTEQPVSHTIQFNGTSEHVDTRVWVKNYTDQKSSDPIHGVMGRETYLQDEYKLEKSLSYTII